MKVAKNSKGKLVKILNSNSEDAYYCPVCGELLERKFGLEKQYYSHPKGIGDNCEIKMKLMLKDNPTIFDSEEMEILKYEYYNKEFNDVKVELSDYKSEEGYYLTEQQKEIIVSKEDRIKVSALAGSAKSSTLYYYAKERLFKKILYIVYNTAMKNEAMNSFGKLRNVIVKTIHGLAFGYVGMYYKHKLTLNYNAVDVMKDLKLEWNSKNQELAVQVYEMMKEYMLSDVKKFEDLEIYKDDMDNKYRNKIIMLCEKLWELKKDYNSNVKVEHDFYLKLFQLSKTDLSRKYNIILLDESQDGNLLLLDVLNNSNVKGIVIVGDPFQSLYGWRKASNIMPLFEGKEYKLTTSFRVSQQIANISNLIISDVSDNDIQMKGFNSKQKIVSKIDKSKPYACLCRTNSYIFAETVDAIENGKKALFYEGGYNSYNFNNIRDGYYFCCGHETTNPLFNKFKNYKQMEKYAEKVDDLELKAIIRMIEEYGSRIPQLIDSIKNNTTKDKLKADVIFSTIHRAKGQTYSIPVLISDDHFDIEKFFKKRFVEKDKELNIADYYEEMCILYVAISRASQDIELSDTLKRYLLLRYKYFNNRNN